ncbi:MAG: AMP-binding protein [Desulfobacteraceae bacterium]|nr:AMP-binding protein [Desulfobacteraceae bacterium]
MPDSLTINGLIESSAGRHPELPALALAFAPALTYGELRDSSRRLSAALRSLGLGAGQTAAILAENSPQWGVAYLGITGCGAVAAPILPDFPDADIHHILREAEARFVFVSQRQLERLADFDGQALVVITLDGGAGEPGEATTSLKALLASGSDLAPPDPSLAPRPADLASLIYTSGTSGHAKAVMLSHANIVANVRSAQAVIGIPPETTFLSILPLAHTYEFTLGFVLPLSQGGKVVYADRRPTPATLERICRHERPQAICAVPLVLEKIYKKRVLPALRAKFWLRQAVRVPGLRGLVLRGLGRRLVDFFGGRLAIMAIGGAAINGETEAFLREANFPFVIGYGLTEAAPLLAVGALGDPSVAQGTVGPPVPGVEIKIRHPDPSTGVGEIMARGENVMRGYYRNPGLTAETIDAEGWLATGDLGLLDGQGNLRLLGRAKSVIVLSHGENIYPEAIEDRINAFPQVVESLVVERGDRIEALVYLDYELADRAAPDREGQRAWVGRLLSEIKAQVNDKLPVYSRLYQVREHPEPFVKTATHKIKRYLYQD